MSFCSLTKGITLKICRLSVSVIINKHSFEPFMCLDLKMTRMRLADVQWQWIPNNWSTVLKDCGQEFFRLIHGTFRSCKINYYKWLYICSSFTMYVALQLGNVTFSQEYVVHGLLWTPIAYEQFLRYICNVHQFQFCALLSLTMVR